MKTGKHLVYISGPMTEIKDFNFPAFFAAESRLKNTGIAVVNPARNKKCTLYTDYLRRDIRKLTYCDGIYLLHGWRRSRGAKLELQVAKVLGLHVYYEKR